MRMICLVGLATVAEYVGAGVTFELIKIPDCWASSTVDTDGSKVSSRGSNKLTVYQATLCVGLIVPQATVLGLVSD